MIDNVKVISEPISESDTRHDSLCSAYYVPTTQQMIGWMREKMFDIDMESNRRVYGYIVSFYENNEDYLLGISDNYNTYEQAELAAIDDVLDHLEKLNTQNQKRMRKKL